MIINKIVFSKLAVSGCIYKRSVPFIKYSYAYLHSYYKCYSHLHLFHFLLQQQKEALHRRGLIRQLEQLFKGNSFIEYVAESRLRYIASEASVILSSISNGNYELEINENTEFIIRMVRENRGISYLPLFAVREWVEQGELAILDVPELKRTLYRQIFYHRNKWLSPEMEEFIKAAESDIVLNGAGVVY